MLFRSSIFKFFEEHAHLANYVRALGLAAGHQPGRIIPGFVLVTPSALSKLLQSFPGLVDLHLRNIAVRFASDFGSVKFPSPKLRQLSYEFAEQTAGSPLRETKELLFLLRLFPDIDQLYLSRCCVPQLPNEPNPHFADQGGLDHVTTCGRVRSLWLDIDLEWLPGLLHAVPKHLDLAKLHTLEVTNIHISNFRSEMVPSLRRLASSLKRLALRLAASQALRQYSQSKSDHSGHLSKGDSCSKLYHTCQTFRTSSKSLPRMSLMVGARGPSLQECPPSIKCLISPSLNPSQLRFTRCHGGCKSINGSARSGSLSTSSHIAPSSVISTWKRRASAISSLTCLR